MKQYEAGWQEQEDRYHLDSCLRPVPGKVMKILNGPLRSFDILVLGAGIAGVAAALHLRRLGVNVALIDRKHPGQEASFGHAGIVKGNGFAPPPLPSRPLQVLTSLSGQSCAASADLPALYRHKDWLKAYREAGKDNGLEAYSRAVAPLRALAVEEHQALAETTNAHRYYRKGGWLHLFRGKASWIQDEIERHYARVFGVPYDELTADGIHALEPGLTASDRKGVYWPQSCSVSDPGAVTDALWRSFVQEGGSSIRGDALTLQRQGGGWVLESERGLVFGAETVVALGAWSPDLLQRLGVTYPFAMLRGYHMHFQPRTGGTLSRPVVDADHGFALTPTEMGIRLSTGFELAERDAPANPAVLKQARRRADDLFPLGDPLQQTPWLGTRLCLPDSLPLCGSCPTIRGLWLNTAHGNDGFTLAPVLGRLLAEQIVGKAPLLDMSAVAPVRFVFKSAC